MFNLDAVANEADGIPFDFTFSGEKFQLPPQPDVIAASLFAQGNFHAGLMRMLGPDQWERMLAADEVMTREKLGALLNAYRAHAGADMGESVASTSS